MAEWPSGQVKERMGITFRPRERRLALLAGVVVGCWVALSWVMQPLWERLHDLRLHVQTRTQKLQALGRLLAQAPAIERASQGVAAYLKTDTGEGAQGAFLNTLEALSRHANTRVSLKPRSISQDDRVDRFEVELDVEGSQQELLAFLDALLQLPELIEVERLRLSTVPARGDLLRANLLIQRLTLRQSLASPH